nr:MAG TPA: antitoxin [Caudoviricetes sp.]
MSESKYARQAAYNRRTYARFPLDIRPEILEAYKAACKKNGTTATTEIKKFINWYIDQYGEKPQQ